ncbi:MAG: hypothetical protein DHS20C03_18100 [Minwuia thermotolerans]|nr:MAG: hypothetical protein DHS20C03_18100 [Minwuia thermotolerans]
MSASPDFREPEKYALDRPAVVRRLYHVLIGLCVLLGLADIADMLWHVYHKHGYFDVEYLPNFYGFFGLLGCIVLVQLSKLLRKAVMRDEDYYDDDVD